MTTPTKSTSSTSSASSIAQRLGPKGITAIVLTIVGIVFIVENSHRAKIRFIIPQVNAPLWLALLISAALGALAGGLFVHRRSGRR